MRKFGRSHQQVLLGSTMLLIMLLFGACHRNAPDQAAMEEGQAPPELQQAEAKQPEPMDMYYQLVPGDTVEITYFFRPRGAANRNYVYKFDIGDELTVEFLYDKNFNFSRMVRPDGRISVPMMGDVVVIDQTPDWLCGKVKETFAKVLQNSECSVSVTKASRKEDELKEAITTQQGRQKDLTVRPDGFLTFPIINEVYAEGKTIPQLYEEVNTLYQKEYTNLETSVQLKGMSTTGVYVAGEVSRPGNYPTYKAVTPLQAIALAGGILPTANLKKVIVITPDKDRKPVRHVVDINKMLKEGDLDNQVLVGYNSIVYVPKTFIAKGNQFVEQYINKLLMFQGYSVGATYLLNGDDDDDNN